MVHLFTLFIAHALEHDKGVTPKRLKKLEKKGKLIDSYYDQRRKCTVYVVEDFIQRRSFWYWSEFWMIWRSI